MKTDAFVSKMDKSHARRRALTVKKAADYAAPDDHLRNFRQIWELCVVLDIDVRQGPQFCALFDILMKIQRRANLMSVGKKPDNESTQGTDDDLHNYVDLMSACEEEFHEN